MDSNYIEKLNKNIQEQKILDRRKEILEADLVALEEEIRTLKLNNQVDLLQVKQTEINNIKLKIIQIDKEKEQIESKKLEYAKKLSVSCECSLSSHEDFIDKMLGIKSLIGQYDYDEISKMRLSERIDILEDCRIKYYARKKINICIYLTILFIVIALMCVIRYYFNIDIIDLIIISSPIIFTIYIYAFTTFNNFPSSGFHSDINYLLFSGDGLKEITKKIVGKIGSINTSHFKVFKNGRDKIKKFYEYETGKIFDDLSAEEQIYQEEKYVALDQDLLFSKKSSFSRNNTHGIIKNVKFESFDINGIIQEGKNSFDFCACVVKIICNIGIPDKVVIQHQSSNKNFISQKYLIDDMHSTSRISPFVDKNLVIYTNSHKILNEILTKDFIEFVNKLSSKYSYVFANGNLYIVIPFKDATLKLPKLSVSLKKGSFLADIEEYFKRIFYIVSLANNLSFLDKPTEEEIKHYNLDS